MQILSGELSWDKLGFQWRRGDLSDHTLNNMKEDGQVSPANSHTVLCDSTLDFDHFNDGQQRNIISCSRAQQKKKKKNETRRVNVGYVMRSQDGIKLKQNELEQGWQTYGPRAKTGPLRGSIRPDWLILKINLKKIHKISMFRICF